VYKSMSYITIGLSLHLYNKPLTLGFILWSMNKLVSMVHRVSAKCSPKIHVHELIHIHDIMNIHNSIAGNYLDCWVIISSDG